MFMKAEKGWRSIPLSLKILFAVLVLWVMGSVFAIPMRSELGLPFFGLYFYGIVAGLIVFLLDIVAPITFLFALLNRKTWSVPFAFSYMGIFILNSVVAFFTIKEQLGAIPIIMPALFNIIFLIVIYTNRNYFK
jgi:hypothetical protein